MRVVIIDDEQAARNLLCNILENQSEKISEIVLANNLKKGVELIKEKKTDLVFLDIEMPQEQGLNIFKYFNASEINFELIFATAYSQYALKAFEMNAIDYLLKPIRPQRVIEIVNKVSLIKEKNLIQQKLLELEKSLKSNSFNKIGLPVTDGVIFIPLEEIIHMQADGMYTTVYTLKNGKQLVSKPLKFFNEALKEKTSFIKTHRSHLVNIKFIKQYVRKDGNYLILENDQTVPISREKKEELLNSISI